MLEATILEFSSHSISAVKVCLESSANYGQFNNVWRHADLEADAQREGHGDEDEEPGEPGEDDAAQAHRLQRAPAACGRGGISFP